MEIKHYFQVFLRKLWLIATIVVVITGVVGVKSVLFTTPIYQANAKLIVNQTQVVDGITTMNLGAVQVNILLINSYKEIIKSTAIMSKVLEKHPDLNVGAGTLASNISVTSASNSQVVNINYFDTSYKRAANIVNAVSDVFSSEISKIMKVNNVTVLTLANPEANMSPINASPVTSIILALFISFVLGTTIVFLLEYFNNTYKSASELEKELGIPVLTTIKKIKKGDYVQRGLKNQTVGDGKYVTFNQ